MQKDYLNAIETGFVLKEEVENEIAILKRVHTTTTDVTCSGNTLTVESDYKNMEAKVEISKEEIIQKVLKEDVSPKEAICSLLKEKVCLVAHDYK